MAQLILPYDHTNGTTADADHVMANFNAIKAIVNSLDGNNFNALLQLLQSGVMHGDLSAFLTPTAMHNATVIKLTDAGGKYVGENVEAALQEINLLSTAIFNTLTGGPTSDADAYHTHAGLGTFQFIGKSKDTTTYGSVSGSRSGTSSAAVIIPAATSTVGIQVLFKGDFQKASGSACYVEAVIGGTVLARLFPEVNGGLYVANNSYATYITTEGWDNTADVTVNITYALDAGDYAKNLELSVFAL